jgi:predicted aminopeptidase
VRERFLRLVLPRRAELATLYASDLPDECKRARKAEIFAGLRADYAAARQAVPALACYEGWFAAGLSNAGLATVSAYHDLVPAFKALLRECHGDLTDFYAQCRVLAEMPMSARRDRLQPPAVGPPA